MKRTEKDRQQNQKVLRQRPSQINTNEKYVQVFIDNSDYGFTIRIVDILDKHNYKSFKYLSKSECLLELEKYSPRKQKLEDIIKKQFTN